MQYLDSFILPDGKKEAEFILSFPKQLEWSCYSDNAYPFKVFMYKQVGEIQFEPVTIFYGSNGSGKSTLLNLISEKLQVRRNSPFNRTPLFEEYLKLCTEKLTFGKSVPKESKIITSDDVFDFLLDIRSINEGIDARREKLFSEYNAIKDEEFQLKSLDDYEYLKYRNEAKRSTISKFVARRIPKEINLKSNGESAFSFFTHEIRKNALYLLDEPENSLSVKLQVELLKYIEDSARFYNCQFIISTHSPFLLSMKGAKIYDLDSIPVAVKKWSELENIRFYYEFFKEKRHEFD